MLGDPRLFGHLQPLSTSTSSVQLRERLPHSPAHACSVWR